MNKRYHSLASIVTCCFLLLLISGCGSSGNKEGDTAAGVSKVSETACTTCHSATVEKLTGNAVVAKYVASVHNLKSVGCQDCHGAGGQHNGVGPIPYPDPTQGQCVTCHNQTDKVKYASSRHAAGADEFVEKCNRCHTHQGAVLANASGYTGDKTVMDAKVNAPGTIADADAEHIKCNTCHESHKPDSLRTVTGWAPSSVVGSATASTNDQYKVCTSCHTYINPDGTLVASGNTVNGSATASFYHNSAWYRVIASTHYDSPATGVGLANTTIEGYVIRTNKANPCLDCHSHDFTTNTGNLTRNSAGKYVLNTAVEATTYTDWAKSAHAGGLLTQKYAAQDAYPKKTDGTYDRSVGMTDAVMVAGVTGTSGPAWEHYDWDASNRQTCQRCHTSTGVSNFLTSPTTYNAALNDFSHLAGWTAGPPVVSSKQNELLYCWGCHSDASKASSTDSKLRKPGALTFTYTNAATATYPDVSGSNVCLACHTGRETGDSIKNDADADGVRSFLNSHYLAAGGQVFGTSGYEYTGLSYVNPTYFKHDVIGTAAAAGTGSNGPCVGCHMSTANKHQFTNVTKSAGVITAITSTACATCHTGNYALTPAKLTEEEEEYQAAIEAAKAAMAGKGIHFYAAHPYWYKAAYVVGGVNTAFTNWAGTYGLASWKDTMGVAFNINLLIHDPGGYAHNRYYVKRLLWDSMDFITNGVLGDIDMTATIDGLAGLTAAQQTAAKAYLGTARP